MLRWEAVGCAPSSGVPVRGTAGRSGEEVCVCGGRSKARARARSTEGSPSGPIHHCCHQTHSHSRLRHRLQLTQLQHAGLDDGYVVHRLVGAGQGAGRREQEGSKRLASHFPPQLLLSVRRWHSSLSLSAPHNRRVPPCPCASSGGDRRGVDGGAGLVRTPGCLCGRGQRERVRNNKIIVGAGTRRCSLAFLDLLSSPTTTPPRSTRPPHFAPLLPPLHDRTSPVARLLPLSHHQRSRPRHQSCPLPPHRLSQPPCHSARGPRTPPPGRPGRTPWRPCPARTGPACGSTRRRRPGRPRAAGW